MTLNQLLEEVENDLKKLGIDPALIGLVKSMVDAAYHSGVVDGMTQLADGILKVK